MFRGACGFGSAFAEADRDGAFGAARVGGEGVGLGADRAAKVDDEGADFTGCGLFLC